MNHQRSMKKNVRDWNHSLQLIRPGGQCWFSRGVGVMLIPRALSCCLEGSTVAELCRLDPVIDDVLLSSMTCSCHR